eukprot:gene1740-1900_t
MGRVWKSITLLSLGSSRLFTAFTSSQSSSFTTAAAATMSSTGKKPWLGSHTNSVAEVFMFPMFKDNYGYLLIEPGTRRAACIDPGEGQAVLEAVRELDVDLVAAWCTHKHADHIGGLSLLQQAIPSLEVIASKYEEGPSSPSRTVEDCEIFSFGHLSVKIFHTPCHTRGHILYYINDNNGDNDVMNTSNKIPLLFSGDTLFVGGCGRFFEGTAADMLHNMDIISTLPPQTQVFCAHEYTESNYKFLAHVHPTLCSEKYEEVKAKRLAGESTVPSTVAEELSFNLFMQCHDKKVQDLLGAQNAEDAMRLLRERKNAF